MTAREKLVAALEGLGYPVGNLYMERGGETYFTYQQITGQPDDYADDDYTTIRRVYRVNLFTKRGYTELTDRAVSALRDAGFDLSYLDAEIYENDTGYYHVPITINYLEVTV